MDGVDVVTRQSILGGEVVKFFPIVARDTAIGPKPHKPIPVAKDDADPIMRQAIETIVVFPRSLFEGSETEVNTSEVFIELNL